ncbi:MAG: hypothetical protein ABIL09_13780 [Gemmatimonadota bacterium]
MKTEKAGSPDYLKQLVNLDPRAAHILKSALSDYKKKTAGVSEERKKLEDERKAIEKKQAELRDEVARWRTSLANAGFDNLPEQQTPAELPEADYGDLLADPKAFANRIRQELLVDLQKRQNETLYPYTEPLRQFGAQARRDMEAARRDMEAARIGDIVRAQPDFAAIKPEVDKIYKSEALRGVPPSAQKLEMAINIYRGQAATQAQRTQRDRVAREELERAQAAMTAGKGGSGRGVPSLPADVRRQGAAAIGQWYSQQKAAGYTDQQIRQAVSGR